MAEGRKAPVSPCKPLCAIFLRKPSVYPLLPAKANVERLCEKLKNAMKSGLGRSCSGNFLAIVAGTILSEKLKTAMKSGLKQRCDGNFLAIFAGVSIGEKPNFSGSFSSGGGRSILVQTGYNLSS